MNTLFELAFCPIHGVFRPDNILMLTNVANSAIIHLTFWLRRLGFI